MSAIGLFDVLGEIGKKNYFIWEQLTEQEQKQFHPFVLLQWMKKSNVNPILLQRFNQQFFSLTKDQQLMVLATATSNKRYNWTWKKPTKEDKLAPEALTAVQECYGIDRSTARSVMSVLTDHEVAEILSEYGDSSSKKTSKKRT